ncbi:hypothetical protein CHARACLAT_013414 [Characodon lateralis]|uniref:Uncharacterized protein n=1 Tax=Characodon lateralis TaxID=208331 RepID=A0ABU7D742_9TELE|nr:hypothetical protein [Characodon lateralis]
MTNITRQSGENTEQVWGWGAGRQKTKDQTRVRQAGAATQLHRIRRNQPGALYFAETLEEALGCYSTEWWLFTQTLPWTNPPWFWPFRVCCS